MEIACDKCGGVTTDKQITAKNGNKYWLKVCTTGCKNPDNPKWPYSFFPPKEEEYVSTEPKTPPLPKKEQNVADPANSNVSTQIFLLRQEIKQMHEDIKQMNEWNQASFSTIQSLIVNSPLFIGRSMSKKEAVQHASSQGQEIVE